MSKKDLLVAGLLCLAWLSAPAQELTLTVDSLMRRVADHNLSVAASRSHYEAVSQGIEVAKSAKLPQISASLDLTYLGDGTVLDRDFTNAMRDKLPHFGNTLKVSIYQPVYQGGAINAGIEMAERSAAVASIGVEQQTETSSIEALSVYFNLLKTRNLRQVYVENIEMTKRLIADMTQRQLQGTVLKNDVTRYELRLSTLNFELQSVDNTISVLNHDLATLLGYPDGTIFLPATGTDAPVEGDEAWWQQQTLQCSSDLRAVDAGYKVAETGLKLEKAARMPSVGIVLGDQLTGPVTFEIPALNKNYNAWFAGVSVQYNLSSLWTAPRRERQRRLEMVHIDSQRLALENALSRRVHEAYIAMVQARQMLATEEVNVRLANENYAVVETRFQNDMALLTDMLDASTSKLDSEVRLVNARISLLLAYYQLKYISGTLIK